MAQLHFPLCFRALVAKTLIRWNSTTVYIYDVPDLWTMLVIINSELKIYL